MKINKTSRKLRNRPLYSVSINVEKDDGTTHNKQFLCKKNQIKGFTAMFLRNITQRAKVVEMDF